MRPIVYFTIEPQDGLEHPDDSNVESQENSTTRPEDNSLIGSPIKSVMETQGNPTVKSPDSPDNAGVVPQDISNLENVDGIEHWRTVPVEVRVL